MEIRDEWDLAENTIDAEREGYMDTEIRVADFFETNRDGVGMSIWAVYQNNRVVMIEFTVEHGFTDRVDLLPPLPYGVLPRPWLRGTK